MDVGFGAVSLALTVLQGLAQYYSSWKDCPGYVQATKCSIQSAVETFCRIEALIKDPNLDSNLVAGLEKSILDCKVQVENLQKKLEKINLQGTFSSYQEKIKAQVGRSAYPFKESTLAKLREIISEIQGHISLVMITLQL